MQFILATNGLVSFVAFVYENVTFLDLASYDFVGFSSGNGSSIALSTVTEKNVFRIDGKCKL